jgi:hypothetical protein
VIGTTTIEPCSSNVRLRGKGKTVVGDERPIEGHEGHEAPESRTRECETSQGTTGAWVAAILVALPRLQVEGPRFGPQHHEA